jgi:GIY-YIG catalytic domain
MIGIILIIINSYLYYIYEVIYNNGGSLYLILVKNLYIIIICFIIYSSFLIFNFDINLYLIFANSMPVKASNLIIARYYDNLADSKIIFTIKKENKGKAGIYRVTNKINGKSYIGSSYRLHHRFYSYFSASGLKRTERVIVQAILKYGLINFSLEV